MRVDVICEKSSRVCFKNPDPNPNLNKRPSKRVVGASGVLAFPMSYELKARVEYLQFLLVTSGRCKWSVKTFNE